MKEKGPPVRAVLSIRGGPDGFFRGRAIEPLECSDPNAIASRVPVELLSYRPAKRSTAMK